MAQEIRIDTEGEHSAALLRIQNLMDAEPGSPEGRELDALVNAVEAYESSSVDIRSPSPAAALAFRMEQAGLNPDDLVSCIGSREKVSELLSGKRPITPSIAIALEERLGIRAETLLPKRSVSG